MYSVLLRIQSATFILACGIVVLTLFPLFARAATTSVGFKDCGAIDANWKEYGRNILGANRKVSDVVLNACAAIGGERECTFNSGYRSPARNAGAGGAKRSQHLRGNAIDVRVTPGKEVAFITLAICGLRRVNNCQGGIGYYRSKAIHVDTRTGRTNVWSTGYSRSDIAGNVFDPRARSLLYGFGDGKCTGGSITGDYSEQDRYGPPVQYAPPQGFPRSFTPAPQSGGYGTPSPQQIAYDLAEPQDSATVGGGEVTQGSLAYRSFEPSEEKSLSTSEGSGASNDAPTQGDARDDARTKRSADDDADGRATCEGSGLFGMSLFRTCKKGDATQSARAVGTGEAREDENTSGNPARFLVGDLPRARRGTPRTVPANNGDTPYTETDGRATNIFYGIHSPDDSRPRAYGTRLQNSDVVGYGQFVAGEARRVVRDVPAAVQHSARFAQFAMRYGTYYGLIYGASPLVFGSAPRTLVRFLQNNFGARVYNPFSI